MGNVVWLSPETRRQHEARQRSKRISEWVSDKLRHAEQSQDNLPPFTLTPPSPEASARMEAIGEKMIADALVVNKLLTYTGPTIVGQD